MAAIEDPGVSLPSRRPAPGRLELVRQFINTADLAPAEEELGDLDALRAWLRERELIGSGDRLDAADLARALAFREALRTMLDERSHGFVDAGAVAALNSLAAGALLRVAFDGEGESRLEPVAGGLARALGEFLAIIERAAVDGTWSRLKICADHGCRWAFYDHSKNRSRSWCNMAVCGNRAKARQYRQRKRTRADPGATRAPTP